MVTEPTPARRARRAQPWALFASVLALLALAASGCGSSSSSSTSKAKTNLNTARVARSIEGSILSQRHLHYRVVCPSAVPQEQGRTFECLATGRNAKHKVTSTPFLVTIQNKRGYVTYVGK